MRIHYLVLAALTGCTNLVAVNLVPTNTAPHALFPRAPGDVKVVSTPPSDAFAEIGFIEGEPGNGYPVAAETILYKMRESAGRWGCDFLLVSSSTFSRSGQDAQGYGGIGYHGTCLVLVDAAKSAAMVKGPPTPMTTENSATSSSPASNDIAGYPSPTNSPQAPASAHALLFRTADGKVYRVNPESRDEAVRAGWVQIGVE